MHVTSCVLVYRRINAYGVGHMPSANEHPGVHDGTRFEALSGAIPGPKELA